MKDFFINNPDLVYSLGVVALFLLGFIFKNLAVKNADSKLADEFNLVGDKISEWAKNQNDPLKRQSAIETVVNTVYDRLPSYIRMFVSKAKLRGLASNLYVKLLDQLDDGINNNSIK